MDIYTFFNMYATRFVYTYSVDLAAEYVNYYMFIASIAVILLSLLVYYILSLKNKDRINERYDMIDKLRNEFIIKEQITNELDEVYDSIADYKISKDSSRK